MGILLSPGGPAEAGDAACVIGFAGGQQGAEGGDVFSKGCEGCGAATGVVDAAVAGAYADADAVGGDFRKGGGGAGGDHGMAGDGVGDPGAEGKAAGVEGDVGQGHPDVAVEGGGVGDADAMIAEGFGGLHPLYDFGVVAGAGGGGEFEVHGVDSLWMHSLMSLFIIGGRRLWV